MGKEEWVSAFFQAGAHSCTGRPASSPVGEGVAKATRRESDRGNPTVRGPEGGPSPVPAFQKAC